VIERFRWLVLIGCLSWVVPVHAEEEAVEDESSPPQVSVKITDTSMNAMAAAGFAAAAQYNNETTEGYEKGYVLDGTPVHETYQEEPKTGTVSAMIGGRYTLEVQTQGLTAEELQAWLKRIDLKALAALKPEEGSTVVHFKKLITFLPQPPSGWSAEKPTGSTSDAAGFKITEVARTYTKP
jgi:hypothetical protein